MIRNPDLNIGSSNHFLKGCPLHPGHAEIRGQEAYPKGMSYLF